MTSTKKNEQLGVATTTKVVRLGAQRSVCSDTVIIEAPLQVFIEQQEQVTALATMMRTPGHDQFLALGFLFSENIINSALEVKSIKQVSDNEVIIVLSDNVIVDKQLQRNFISYSGCGICGKASIKQLALRQQRTIDDTSQWLAIEQIIKAANSLKEQQTLFQITGGCHGAALAEITTHSFTLIKCHEDVGRHNAVDKLIGEHLLTSKANKKVLLLSGRISFELVQKAVMAGISVIAAIGAPSNLAIQTAKQFNLTLIGFIKPEQANIYCGDWRLIMPEHKHDI